MTDGETIAIVGVSLAALYLYLGSETSELRAPVVSCCGTPIAQPPSRAVGYHAPRADAVAFAKDQLGNPQGPCGAKAIIQLAARNIGEGCGLVDKPSGNNCDGVSVDVHIYPDGAAFDVLGDSGGANNPQYNAIDPIDPSRWREP